MAIASPLLETSICGSKGIIINITASPDISMDDIDIAASLVTSEAHEDATVIFGVVFDPELEDTMKVTIIATGFENENEPLCESKKGAGAAAAAAKPVETREAPAEEKPADTADAGDDISDDDLDELLGMLSNKEKKNDSPATGLKRYF